MWLGLRFAVVLLAGLSFAQDLVTDRPDQTESAEVAGARNIQVEMGVKHDQVTDDFENDAYGEFLIRMGIGDQLEFRFTFAGYNESQLDLFGGSFKESGMGDTGLGMKWKISEESGRRPQTALLVSTSVPTGDDAFTSDEVEPAIRLLFSNALTEKIGVGYNLGLASARHEDAGGEEHTLAFIQGTLSFGVSLTDRWNAFFEVFADVPTSLPGKPETSLDGGLTYLITPLVQWDVYYGSGLSDAAGDWFAGTGVSFRFDR